MNQELFILTEERRWRKIEHENKPAEKAEQLMNHFAQKRQFRIRTENNCGDVFVVYGYPIYTEEGREMIWTTPRKIRFRIAGDC